MRFFNRLTASFSNGSQARLRRRIVSKRSSPIACEVLEGRSLMSVAGVSLSYGNIAITATKPSGNVASVSIDPSNGFVNVTLNGQSEEFAPSLVANVTYTGGSGGGDTFTNNTNLVELAYGYGGHNSFTGGTSYNYVYFFGNYNNYTSQGGYTDVWEGNGSHDTIDPNGTVVVYKY